MKKEVKVLLLVVLLGLVRLHATDANSGPRTLVLLDDASLEQTHSMFFQSLTDRGHSLDIREVYDEETRLEKYGQYFYENLIIFAPSAEDFGEGMSVESIVAFIDSGRNVLMAVNENVTEPIREIANECGVDFDEEDTRVIDHMSYDTAADTGAHTTIAVSPAKFPAVLLGKGISAPVLFSGIGHAAAEGTRLITKILTGTPTTYSAAPNKRVEEYPQSAGTDTLLVTAVQARNNARVLLSGSLAMFSNEFFTSAVSQYVVDGAAKKFAKSGNEDFAAELSKWTFQERGLLRASPITHKHVGGSVMNPSTYRVKDEIEVSLTIEEYDGASHSWKPFTGNDVQLEFVMIDPYVRTNLKHDGKGLFSTRFTVPDVYGVFKHVISYHRVGYSSLELSHQVPVHPFRHNEFERFIDVAYPYYASAFSVMAAFFLFGLLFMYSGDS